MKARPLSMFASAALWAPWRGFKLRSSEKLLERAGQTSPDYPWIPGIVEQGVVMVARRVSEASRLFTLAYASGFHGPMNKFGPVMITTTAAHH